MRSPERADEFNCTHRLRDHREIAVIARLRFCQQSFRYFALHQKYGSAESCIQFEELANDRRGDVVGQIATDGSGPPLRNIGVEHVRLVHHQLRFSTECVPQMLGQGGVQFYGVQLIRARKQMFCERAASGSDLDCAWNVRAARRFGQLLQDGLSNQKMLSQSTRQNKV